MAAPSEDEPGELVREAIRRAGGNERAIARRIAVEAGDPASFEKWRRLLYRLINGARAEPENAALVAAVLQIDPGLITVQPRQGQNGRQESREAEIDALYRSGAALLGAVVYLADQVRSLGGQVPDHLLRAPDLEELRKHRPTRSRSAGEQ